MDQKRFILFFLLCPVVFGEDCVTYSFEEDFESLFSKEKGICNTMEMWDIRNYSSIPIASPHHLSTTFISPKSLLSCVSSFTFLMSAGGVFEVNLYMDPASQTDQISFVVNEVVSGGDDASVGNTAITPMNPTFEIGWHALRITLRGSGTYEGYVSLVGMASSDSIILIDSFRYIPPQYNEESCKIYQEVLDITTTTLTESTYFIITTESSPTDSESTTLEQTDITTTTVNDNVTITPMETTTNVYLTTVKDNTDVTNHITTTEQTTTQIYTITEEFFSTTADIGTTMQSEITDPIITTTTVQIQTVPETTSSEIDTTTTTLTVETSSESDTKSTILPTVTDNLSTPSISNTTSEQVAMPSTTTEMTTLTEIPDKVTTTTTTEDSVEKPNTDSSFWTPLVITMVVLLSLLILILTALFFYYMGKRKGLSQAPVDVFADFEDVSKPITVPRVTKILAEPYNFKKIRPV